MKTPTLLVRGGACIVALAWAGAVLAQGPGGFATGHSDNPNGPTVSPYLNLLQNNQIGSVSNYQSLVKPLIEQNSALQRQGSSLSRLQQQVMTGAVGGGTGTGHASFFMNYSHFYSYSTARGRR